VPSSAPGCGGSTTCIPNDPPNTCGTDNCGKAYNTCAEGTKCIQGACMNCSGGVCDTTTCEIANGRCKLGNQADCAFFKKCIECRCGGVP
jgi:hypothetical protein